MSEKLNIGDPMKQTETPMIVTNGRKFRIRIGNDFVMDTSLSESGLVSRWIWETRFLSMARRRLARMQKRRAASSQKEDVWMPV